MSRSLFIIVFACLLIPGASSGQEMHRSVEAKGEAILSEDSTPMEAKAIALNNARQHAIEEAVGIVVTSRTDVYNFQVISDFVTAATKGLIVRENILENKCVTRDGQIMCAARIEALVKPLSLERKGNLKIVNASVQRPDRDTAARAPVFQSKDEIQIKVSVSEDSYVNLFSIDQYGAIAKIFPNDYATQKKISPGTQFVFPTNDERTAGLKIRVSTPKGIRKAVESVLVIITREKVTLMADATIENPTIADLMREVSELDQSNWADRTVGYEVKE